MLARLVKADGLPILFETQGILAVNTAALNGFETRVKVETLIEADVNIIPKLAAMLCEGKTQEEDPNPLIAGIKQAVADHKQQQKEMKEKASKAEEPKKEGAPSLPKLTDSETKSLQGLKDQLESMGWIMLAPTLHD